MPPCSEEQLLAQKHAQQRVHQLVTLADRSPPDSQEARNAALAALKLIREYGLLIIRPDEIVTFAPALAPSPPIVTPPAPRKRKAARSPKKPPAQVVNETAVMVTNTADVVTSAIDAGSRVAASFNGLVNALRR